MERLGVRETITERKGPAAWTKKEPLVLHFPQWGRKDCGWWAGALRAHASEHKSWHVLLPTFKQLFAWETLV